MRCALALVAVLSLLGCQASPAAEQPPVQQPTASATGTSSAPRPGTLDAFRGCTRASECVHLGDYCHFGCSITVNRAHEEEAKALMSKREQCSMDCPPVDPPACEKGTCVSPQR